VTQQFNSKIYIEHNGQTVDGDSILDILTLACPYGGMLTIKAEGDDALAAVEELEKLVENKFGED
jgi:phosphocarrier protein